MVKTLIHARAPAAPSTYQCKCQPPKRSNNVLALSGEDFDLPSPLKVCWDPRGWRGPWVTSAEQNMPLRPQELVSFLSLIAEKSVIRLTYCKTIVKSINFSGILPVNTTCSQNKTDSQWNQFYSSLGLVEPGNASAWGVGALCWSAWEMTDLAVL